MATKTLYPIYMTSGVAMGDLLSSDGTGADYRTVEGTYLDVGTIAFDGKLQNLSKACVMHKFSIDFDLKNQNIFATSGVEVHCQPKLISNYYTSGNNIVINACSDYGSEKSAHNAAAEYKSFNLVFFENWQDQSCIGYNKLLGFYMWITRESATWSTEARFEDLKATVEYTPRYFARFYDIDGNLIERQTLDSGVSPTVPDIPEVYGYEFLGWQCNGTLYSDSIPAGTETDIDIKSVYRKLPVITSKCNAGGTVTPLGETLVTYSGEQKYTIVPDEGYYVKNVIIDGTSQGETFEYRFPDVVSDHTITVEFAKYCSVTMTPYDVHGIVKGKVHEGTLAESDLWFNYTGETWQLKETSKALSVYAEPDEGYRIKSFTRTSYNPDAGNEQTTELQSEDTVEIIDGCQYTYNVEFVRIVNSVTKETDGNGSIVGPDNVEYSEDATYTITPNDHYVIKDVLLDGVSVIGEVSLNGNMGTFTLHEVKTEHTVSAIFQPVVYITYDVGDNGSVDGPELIEYGTSVYCTAKANDGYSVETIKVGSGTTVAITRVKNEYVISLGTLTEDVTVKVTFTDNISSFNIVQPVEGGSISSSATGDYVTGSMVQCVAQASNGWYFTSWSDGNTESERVFALTEDTELTATFEKYGYTVTTSVTSGNGSVVPDTAYAEYGDPVVFEAVPDEGYVFSEWEDGSTAAKRVYTVTENANLTATFKKGFYEVKAYTEEGGTVTGSGTYEFGSEVTLKAEADTGYYFELWNDGYSANERTIIVPAGGCEYIASFKKFEYDIVVECGAGGSATETQKAKYGDSLNIEIRCDIGFKIRDITVDGESVYEMLTTTKDGGRYLLTEIKANHIVNVFFTERRYRFSRKLLDYYPPVIRNILEFIELSKVQENLVGQVWDAVSLAYDNQFIDDATEEGVESWEKDYSIVSSKAETLKQRKQYLKSKWVPNSKYTYEWLVRWLKAATGKEDITVPLLTEYTLKTYLPINCSYNNILEDMRKYVPSNIVIKPVLQFEDFEQKLYTGTAFRLRIKTKEPLKCEKVEVTTDNEI